MLVALLATAAAVAHAPAHAGLQGCLRSTDVDARAAVFEGSMRAWRHSARLQLRFRLQAQTPDQPVWRTVDADGFGQWQSADPGVRRYVYDKRVERLLAPAAYRAVVHFRWRDARGRIVGRARRVTPACREPDPRPDLTVRRLTVTRTGPRTAHYAALIANGGRTAAGAFTVRFDLAGAPLGDVPAGPLRAGATERVELDRPACAAAQALMTTVDPGGRVDERDESNNQLVSACAYTQRRP